MNHLKNFKIFERKFSEEKRDRLADKEYALPDGSFPIVNKKDLKNAIVSQGRGLRNANQERRDKVHRHIKKRAKDLGVPVKTNPETGNIVLKDED